MAAINITTKDINVLVNGTQEDSFSQTTDPAQYNIDISTTSPNVSNYQPEFVKSDSNVVIDDANDSGSWTLSLPEDLDFNYDIDALLDLNDFNVATDTVVTHSASVNGTEVASGELDNTTGIITIDETGTITGASQMQVTYSFDSSSDSDDLDGNLEYRLEINILQNTSSTYNVNSVTQS